MEDEARDPIGRVPKGPSGTVVPIFPLSEHVVFPGIASRYRLFEPRYRELARHLLLRPEISRWLAIPRLRSSAGDDLDLPYFLRVATLGRAVQLEPLPSGQFSMVFLGIERVLLSEVTSPHPFRLATVQPWTDDVSEGDVEPLVQGVKVLAGMFGDAGAPLRQLLKHRNDPQQLVYALASVLIMNADQRQNVLVSPSFKERCDLVLEQIGLLIELAARRSHSGGNDSGSIAEA